MKNPFSIPKTTGVQKVEDPVVLGLDPSWTALAMCGLQIIEKKVETWPSLLTSEKEDFLSQQARMDCLGRDFMAFVEDVFPTLIAIEGYAMGSKTRPQQAGELGGHLRWLLWKAKYPFVIVPPTVLKKYVTGKGNAAKEVMMMIAYKRWNYEAVDNNACDAYCLARFAHEFLQERRTKTFHTLAKKCEHVS